MMDETRKELLTLYEKRDSLHAEIVKAYTVESNIDKARRLERNQLAKLNSTIAQYELSIREEISSLLDEDSGLCVALANFQDIPMMQRFYQNE